MRVLVNGTGFTQQSQVHFGGASVATEFVTASQLAFEADVDEPGEVPVNVVTPPGPGGGGGESNTVPFEVREPEAEAEPEPAITSLQPNSMELPAGAQRIAESPAPGRAAAPTRAAPPPTVPRR